MRTVNSHYHKKASLTRAQCLFRVLFDLVLQSLVQMLIGSSSVLCCPKCSSVVVVTKVLLFA